MDTLIHDEPSRLRVAVRRAADDTPRCLMLVGAVLAALAVALVTLLASGTSAAGSALAAMSAKTAEVSATNDLYFRLNDMDAQASDVLLVGYHPAIAVPASVDATASSSTYQSDRAAADGDLQKIALNPALAASYTRLLDALGDYEALIGQALYTDQGTPSQAPAAPPAAALGLYQQASSIMHDRVLPPAAQITAADSTQLATRYTADRGGARTSALLVAVCGLLLALALLVANRLLARRFRRVLSAALLAGVALALSATGLGTSVLLHEAGQLKVAKQDAFDSINALTRARAVSYDANADESRWLLDRTDVLQQQFFAKVSQIAAVPGIDGASAAADPSAYYAALHSAVSALSLDQGANSVANVKLGGFLGTELNNITFTGEAQDADQTTMAFDAYVQDDATIRADVDRGDLAGAVALDIGTQPGQSNYAYYRYDQALERVIAINQDAFKAAIDDGRSSLHIWSWLPYATGAALLALIGAGLYPRVREYR